MTRENLADPVTDTPIAGPPARKKRSWGMLAASLAMFALFGVAHAYQDVSRASAPIAKAFFPKAPKAQPKSPAAVAP